MDIEAVVFDIGNVLIRWDPESYFDSVIGEDRRRDLFATVDLHAMNEKVDLGAPLKQAAYECADQYPEFRDEIRMWHSHWIDMASPAIDHSVRLLLALRKRGVRVFALTNFGGDLLKFATTQYPFLAEFEARFVSGDLELVKPNPEIYAVLEEGTGIAPDRLLFADDRHENILAAKTRGWQTHLFDGPQGWADRLQHHGLLTQSEAR